MQNFAFIMFKILNVVDMQNDLLSEVQTGLRKNKDKWRLIAKEVPEVSFSWVSQLGRGKYASSPAYDRLTAVAAWLRKNKTTKKAA